MTALRKMWLNINGANRMFMCDPEEKLSDVLRRIGCTSVKVGCDVGVCGSCSIILNGEVVRSCTKRMKNVEEYSQVITVEGVGTPMHPHPIQVAFMNCGSIQCGFCIPGFVISAYALLKKNPDPTRQDVRDWFTKNKNVCRCTGYKQIVDGVMAAAKVLRGECTLEDISFKAPEDGEFYGKPVVRPSALAKVCGVADYGDDQELKMPPHSYHCVMVQPRVCHHGLIKNIDISEAQEMPGVAKVILAKDIIAAGGTNIMPEGQFHERSQVTAPSRKILCDAKIFRWGDPVAIVAADTKQHARDAAAKVKVDVEKLPEYLTYLDAVMPDAIRVHEETPNIYAEQPVMKGVGLEDPTKVGEIIENSAYSVEGSFHSTREPHLTIEGDPVQAYYDEEGRLTFQCKSQGLYSSLGRLGNSLGLRKDQMRVIMNPTGASFGWSTNAGDLALVGAAALVMQAPCALSMTYEEHQHYSGKRCASYSNGRVGCDKDGHITAAEFDVGLDHGAYSWGGDDMMTKPIRFTFFPYYIPHAAGLSRIANTNHTFGTAYRSYGSPQAYTCSEALMDMLAEKAGIDPFEFRWINIAREGQTNLNSYPFRQYPMEEMMKIMRPLYDKAVAEAKAADTPAKRRGVGLAWGGFNVTEGPTDLSTVYLELLPDGRIAKYDTYQDVGQGGDIGSLMVTLEALKPLGVTPDDIQLIQNDTAMCPDTGLCGASRTHLMSGNATILAANKLLDAMRKPDGSYRNYDEMVAAGIPTKYEGAYSCSTVEGLCRPDPNTGIGDPTPAYTYCLNMAEVEVDTATGKATCIRFTCVDDVGKIGNIQAVNGQAYGGISHSIGFALSEDYQDVNKHKNIASSGVPYCNDIPDEINVIHYTRPDEVGPFGSSGASEAFQSSGHVAVLNAIKNACGVRIHEMPATKDKIKAGLDAIAAGKEPYKPAKYFLGSDLYEELENIMANPVKFGGEDFFVPLNAGAEKFF